MRQFFDAYFSGSSSPSSTNVFDNNFINSIIYENQIGYNVRNAFSEWKFQYSGVYLGLKVKPTLYSTFPVYTSIQIIVNGVYYLNVKFTDETIKEIILPTGNKTIQLIEGALNKPSTIFNGTFLTEIWLHENRFTKINETSVSEKIVVLGDSISTGFKPDNPQQGTWSRRFSSSGGRNVGILGWGNGQLYHYAGDSTKRAQTISYIQNMLSNVTTTKKLAILIGTNDWAVGVNLTNFDQWYKDLIDDLNALDSSIQMFCISPLARSGDNSNLDTMRSNIDTMCSTRSFATHIAGKTILTYPDYFADIVHPNEGGHTLLYSYLSSIL